MYLNRTIVATSALCLLGLSLYAGANNGPNINIVGPTPSPPPALVDGEFSLYVPDVGIKQQNESSCAVKPDLPTHYFCAYNDYRLADDPLRGGDAWQGVSMSRDGGLSWLSRLAPGYRGYRADEGLSIGYEFAADPTVVAVPGMAFLNFISKNRGTGNDGGLYLMRWWDTNRETQFPWEPDPNIIQITKGSTGRFIDLPDLIFNPDPNAPDISTSGNNEQGEPITRVLPGGQLVVAYTVFTGNDNNNGTQIIIRTSSDAGITWSQGFKITESVEVNQGVKLAADPDSDNLVAVWRRFTDPKDPDATPTDAIMYATSSNRGQRWSKPRVLRDLACPFDHPSTQVTFRSNGYPAIAHDGDAFRVFWSERVTRAGQTTCENGLARIHTSERAGQQWTTPSLVDEGLDSNGTPAGHQFMPAAFAAQGEVQVVWTDTRNDLIVTAFDEALGPDASLTINLDDQPDLAFLTELLGLPEGAREATIRGADLRDAKYIFDFHATASGELGRLVFRHSGDIRGASGTLGNYTPSEQISQYRFSLRGRAAQRTVPIEYNWLNPRLFKQGQFPFNGDYLWVTAPGLRQNSAGQWVSNAPATQDPSATPPAFLVTWGDNRDVRGDVWIGNEQTSATEYSPASEVEAAAAPLDDPTPDFIPSCELDPDGALDLTRNQNVYSAVLRPAFEAGTASAYKPIPLTTSGNFFQRAYVLTFANQGGPRFDDDPGRTYRLSLDPPTGVDARFNEDTAQPTLLSLDATVAPFSQAARTVFVSQTDEAQPSIEVSFEEVTVGPDGSETLLPLGSVTLNPNDTAAELENIPGISTFDDLLQIEVHTPEILAWGEDANGNPVFRTAGSFDFDNPGFLNFELQTPSFLNPSFLNPGFLNPGFRNPGFRNPSFLNPSFLNPGFRNLSFLNPGFRNTGLEAGDAIANESLRTVPAAVAGNEIPAKGTDISFILTNSGNTTTAYNLSPFLNGSRQVTQLIGSRLYAQPAALGCELGVALQNHVVFNIIDPQLRTDTNPDLLAGDGAGVGTVYLAPREVFLLTLRIWGETGFNPERVGLNIYAQSCDTQRNEQGGDCEQLPQDQIGELDVEAPVITPSTGAFEDVSVNAPGGANVNLLGLAIQGGATISIQDNSDPAPGVSCETATASCTGTFTGNGDDTCALFVPVTPGGPTSIACHAEDAVGNRTEVPATFSLAVIDDVAPQVSVADVTVATTTSGATVDYVVSVFDQGDPGVAVVCDPPSGGTFAIGISTVTCSATDASGNTGIAQFSVAVDDTAPPVLTVPQDVTLDDTGQQFYAFAVSATDNAPDDPELSCTANNEVLLDETEPGSFSGTFSGVTLVTCVATDAAGNQDQASFSITVPTLEFIGLFTPNAQLSPGEQQNKPVRAGSSTPLTWQYALNGNPVDSAAVQPDVQQSEIDCQTGEPVVGAGFPGNSDLRYKASSLTWQLNWTAPDLPGCYGITVQSDGQSDGPFFFRVK